MYEKNTYKCMTKTRIKTCIQMYEKKQAYKCMTKTRIKMYDKKKAYKCMIKNTHTNV